MLTKRFTVLILVLGLLLTGSLVSAQDVTLTILTHWGEEIHAENQAKMYGYCADQTGVAYELRTVPFNDLLTTIVTGRTAGTNPDIYHLYNLWLPDFTGESGLLSTPPQAMVDEIIANSPAGVVEGVTANGQVWGYPTEVNTYLLLWNKRLFEEAGYTAAPQTWDELKEIAAAITKVDDTGAITQAGYGVLTGWDSGVVHPWSAYLLSNGGSYMNEDATATAFNSPEGLEALQLYADLLENGGMDMSVAGWDFPNGKVGMTVMANWWRATLIASEAVDYETEVGVAPVPVGPSGDTSMTLSYNWLWSVDATSQQQEKAWEFVQCLNTDRGDGTGSPSGEFLVKSLGAIPSLLFDQEAYSEDLGDFFLTAFVESTNFAKPEPVVAGGQEVKTYLQAEIEAVLSGLTDPESALMAAADSGDAVLAEMASQ